MSLSTVYVEDAQIREDKCWSLAILPRCTVAREDLSRVQSWSLNRVLYFKSYITNAAAVVPHDAWTPRSSALYDKGGFIKPPFFQHCRHRFHSNLQHHHPFSQQMPFVHFLAQFDLWPSAPICAALVWIHLLMIYFNCQQSKAETRFVWRWPALAGTSACRWILRDMRGDVNTTITLLCVGVSLWPMFLRMLVYSWSRTFSFYSIPSICLYGSGDVMRCNPSMSFRSF